MKRRMCTRIWFALLPCLIVILNGCESPVALEVEAEPLLQVDATFFSGAPFPVVKVRRTFKATGTDRFEVTEDQIWAEGATVQLLRNSQLVVVAEIAPGRFEAQDKAQVVLPGDTFRVAVQWKDLQASAVAAVPEFEKQNIHVSIASPIRTANTRLRNVNTGLIDTLATYVATVNLHQDTRPEVELIQIASASERTLEENYGNVSGIAPSDRPLSFTAFFQEDATSDSISLTKQVFEYQSTDDERSTEMVVKVVSVVPEPIYGDYIRTQSDFFTPVTVTNVEGGVGLFIGAKRDTLTYVVPL